MRILAYLPRTFELTQTVYCRPASYCYTKRNSLSKTWAAFISCPPRCPTRFDKSKLAKNGREGFTARTNQKHNTKEHQTCLEHCLGHYGWRMSSWNLWQLRVLRYGRGKKRGRSTLPKGRTLGAYYIHCFWTRTDSAVSSCQGKRSLINTEILINVTAKRIAHQTEQRHIIGKTGTDATKLRIQILTLCYSGSKRHR